jgi:hypothetical protein
MTINIGEVLTRAWQISWKHKVLWIFGILAGCSASGGGNNVSYQFSQGDLGTLPPQVEDAIERLVASPETMVGIIAAVFALVCVISLLVLALSTIGRIGLITGTHRADGGAARLAFGELVQASRPYFWRVFGLHFLLGLAVFVLVALSVAVGVALAVATFGVALLCLIPLVCLLIPLAWLITVILEQADNAIVIEDLSIPDGLSRAWRVITANLGAMVALGLILFVGIAIVSILIALPFFLVAFPAFFAYTAAGPRTQNTVLALGLLCGCLYLPVLLVLNGLVQTYYHSAWTLTFMRSTGRGPALPAATPVPASPQPLDA